MPSGYQRRQGVVEQGNERVFTAPQQRIRRQLPLLSTPKSDWLLEKVPLSPRRNFSATTGGGKLILTINEQARFPFALQHGQAKFHIA